MKICTYCGSQIPDAAQFCNVCGSVQPSTDMQQPYYAAPVQGCEQQIQQQPYCATPMQGYEQQIQQTPAPGFTEQAAPQPVAACEPPAPQKEYAQQPPAPQQEYIPQPPAPQPQPAPAAQNAVSAPRPPRKIWLHMRTRVKRLIMLSIRLAFLALTILMFLTIKSGGTGDTLEPEAEALIAIADDNKNNDLSIIDSLKLYAKAARIEIKAKGRDHYLTGRMFYKFWWFLMTTGIMCFVWNDLRMSAKFGHLSGVEADKTTFYWDVFVNGSYSYSYKTEGSYVITFPIVTLFTLIVLEIIFPIRFAINVLMDVVGIITGSEKMGDFSVTGNVLASISLYAIIIALLSGPKDNIVTLIIAGILFIAACVINKRNIF